MEGKLPTEEGKIDASIGRDPRARQRMAVMPPNKGRKANSEFSTIEEYKHHTLAKVNIFTGRTHQIRVHMAHINHALVGDPVYAGRFKIPAGITEEFKQALRSFRRQALHAKKLTLTHPETLEEMSWEVPLPEDMLALIATIAAQEE